MSSIKNIIMIVIVLLLLLFGIKQQIDINTKEQEIKELVSKLEDLNDKVEELEYLINMSDEESLDNEAKDAFYDPDARHFTNDYSN